MIDLKTPAARRKYRLAVMDMLDGVPMEGSEDFNPVDQIAELGRWYDRYVATLPRPSLWRRIWRWVGGGHA